MEDIGKLILRLAVGGLMLPHGMAKFSELKLAYIQKTLGDHGLPAFLSYGVYVGEVLAPILIIIGFYSRPAAVIVAINMVMAIYLSHSSELISINSQTGGLVLDLQYLYLFAAIAISLIGAGKYSISGGTSKWD